MSTLSLRWTGIRAVAGSLWTVPLLAALAGARTCCGQETVTFDIRFSDSVLTPGESQQIELWAVMEPGIGQVAYYGSLPGHVFAFGWTKFNFLNIANGQTGTFSDLALNPILSAGGVLSPGTPDGQGNVLGAEPGQLPIAGGFSAANPLLLWQATWTPDSYTERDIEFTTGVFDGPYVYLELGLGLPEGDVWVPVIQPTSFAVVPAPGGALIALLSAGAWAARARRRSRLPSAVSHLRGSTASGAGPGVSGSLAPARPGGGFILHADRGR